MNEPSPRPARPVGRAGAHLELPILAPLPTASERAADLIREHIFNGRFQPGAPLPETALATALQVSRNTVRDAFRTLIHERLLSYEQHRGVAVRTLAAADVRDIYGLRRLYELSSIDLIEQAGAAVSFARLRREVEDGERSRKAEQWADLGTVNLRFHTELVALRGSERADEYFRRLLTELRLGFLAVPDPRALHEPYVPRNAAILSQLEAGDYRSARAELAAYLDDAERQVVAAVSA
jgi:DNA-binding GntR family transcriptional regulator